MAVQGPGSRFLYMGNATAGGFNISSAAEGITEWEIPQTEHVLQETTSPFVVAPTYLPTTFRRSTDFSAKFLYGEPGVSGLTTLIESYRVPAAVMPAQIAVWGTATDVVGMPYDGASMYQATLTPDAPKELLTQFGVAFRCNPRAEPGHVCRALASVAIDGNTEATPVDCGVVAGSTAGLSAYLVVTAMTAADVTVTVEESALLVGWADTIVFTLVTAAKTYWVQRSTHAGDVLRYLACKWVYTGAAASTFFVGVNRY